MEDNLQEIFRNYRPKLSSDDDFMSALRKNMRMVDAVKEQVKVGRRNTRKAMMGAGLAGFVFGMLSMAFYPFLVKGLALVLVNAGIVASNVWEMYHGVISCAILAVVGFVVVWAAFDIIMGVISGKIKEGPRLSTI